MSDYRNQNDNCNGNTCCEQSQNNHGGATNGQRKKLHCPQCGSYNFTVTTETSVEGGDMESLKGTAHDKETITDIYGNTYEKCFVAISTACFLRF